MDIGIVGGGLCGPLAAVYLARRGHAVTLYERRADPRLTTTQAGRSINLALSARGIDALQKIGLEADVMQHALPMHGRTLHDLDGTTAFQSYSSDGVRAINSVSRDALNQALLTAAERTDGVRIRFEHHVVEAATTDSTATLRVRTPDGGDDKAHDLVIGTDGAFSAVRDRLVHSSRTEYHQEALPWGYKELAIPATSDGGFALDPNALHIWPRGHSMMIALPNPDHSFTATLFWPHDGPDGFAGLDDPVGIQARFQRDYPDAMHLIPHLVDAFIANPIGTLLTVRMWPWTLGRLAVLGDAAHAIVPFYGQGMNCAFEDIVELDRCLDETDNDVVSAVALCAQRRKPNADAIADMALDNFVEMRDRVASPWFRLAKKAEHRLERLAPDRFTSLYELISFTTVPYAEARRRCDRQRRVTDTVVHGLDVAGNSLRRLVGKR